MKNSLLHAQSLPLRDVEVLFGGAISEPCFTGKLVEPDFKAAI